MYDDDALDQLHESLSANLKNFSRHVPVQENLVVEKRRVIRNQTKSFHPYRNREKRNRYYLVE